MKIRTIFAALFLIFGGMQAQAETEDISESVVGVVNSSDELVDTLRTALEKHFGTGNVDLTTQEWGLVIDGEVVTYSKFRSVDLSKIKQLLITTDGMRSNHRKAIVDLVTADFVDITAAAAES